MDISSIKYFLSVVQYKNFTEAAEAENISQSALSKAIIRLEDELGVKLFDRQRHPVELTEAGECLKQNVQKLLPGYQTMMREIHQYSKSREIYVMCCPSDRPYQIKHVIEKFRQENEDIHVIVKKRPLNDQIGDAVKRENPDFIFTYWIYGNLPRYTPTILKQDDLIVVMPQDYPMAQKEEIEIEDLASEQIFKVGFCEGIYDDLQLRYGFTPNNVTEIEERYLDAVVSGIPFRRGVSIMRYSDISRFREENICVRPIVNCASESYVMMAHERTKSEEYYKRFKEFMIDKLQ